MGVLLIRVVEGGGVWGVPQNWFVAMWGATGEDELCALPWPPVHSWRVWGSYPPAPHQHPFPVSLAHPSG